MNWQKKNLWNILIMAAAEWEDYGGSYSLHICTLLVSSSINIKNIAKVKMGFIECFMA